MTGSTAKRRSVWIRGDYMIRIEAIAAAYPCPVSRLIDAAIDTYVDYYTRGIDPKLVATLIGTSRTFPSSWMRRTISPSSWWNHSGPSSQW